MMSEKFDLLGAMGEISEKYVAEHMERSAEKSARKMTKRAWIGVAACAAVVCASVVGVMASRGTGTTDVPTDRQDARTRPIAFMFSFPFPVQPR